MAARGFAEPVEGNRDSNKIFTIPSAFSLPKSLGFNIANLKKIGRKAGTEANHKSAAASAWLLANAASHFEAAPMAWTGFGLCWNGSTKLLGRLNYWLIVWTIFFTVDIQIFMFTLHWF